MDVQYKKNELKEKQYASLRQRQNMPPINAKALETAIRNSQLTVSAVVDGETVGMLRVIGDGALFCYIQDVLVDARHRSLGIGHGLMRTALDWIEESTPTGIHVVVSLIAEPGLEAFYEPFGFTKTPNILTGHAMQCILCGAPRGKRYYFKEYKRGKEDGQQN